MGFSGRDFTRQTQLKRRFVARGRIGKWYADEMVAAGWRWKKEADGLGRETWILWIRAVGRGAPEVARFARAQRFAITEEEDEGWR